MTCSELSSLILQNRDSIAFLVGNGVHLYEKEMKCATGKVSWLELIEKINDTLLPQNMICDNVQYSLLDAYDDIVIEYDRSNANVENGMQYEPIKSLVESVSNKDIKNWCWQRCANEVVNAVDDIDLSNIPNVSYFEKHLCGSLGHIVKRTKEILNSFGLSYQPDTYDSQMLALYLCSRGEIMDSAAKNIIRRVFSVYTLQDWIKQFLFFARNIKAPILTTNYDESFSRILNLKLNKITGCESVQTGFPLESYYGSSQIEDPLSDFAIWHIHGLIHYPNSIRISSTDYDNLKREIQNRINDANQNWQCTNTWLDIVFKRNLFVFGLGLSPDEEVIRFLLEERAKYYLRGWYLVRKNENVDEEKRNFLDRVGFIIIKVDVVDLYENVWQKLNSVI